MAWYFFWFFAWKQGLSSNSVVLTEDMTFFCGIQGIYVIWLRLLYSSVQVQFGAAQIPHTANVENAGMIQRIQAKCLKEFEGDGVNTTCVSTLNLIFQ